MGIGSITSMNSMSHIQTTVTGSTESKNKNIQNEITDAQRQMRALSSKEELSVNEKANERKTLQKKIASLNTELKQHEEEFRKSQKREIMMAKLQEDTGPAKDGASETNGRTDATSLDKTAEQSLPASRPQTEETKESGIAEKEAETLDTGTDAELSRQKKSEAVSADPSQQQAELQGTVITRTNDGVVILKEEMKQDKSRSIDTETKTANTSSLHQEAEQTSPTDKLQTDETKESGTSEKETKPLERDTGLSDKEIHGIVSADASVRQIDRQETVIARIQGGIAILKGEMKQDEMRGTDTGQKQAELEKMEQREERARTFQTSVLGEASDAMKSAAKADQAQNSTQFPTKNNTFIRAFQLSEEAQAAQQRFYISLDN